MSGLLQRIVGQAMRANAARTSGNEARIRPAASVHAHAPVALPAQGEPEQLPQHLVNSPGETKLVDERVAGAVALSEPKTGYETRQAAAPPTHAAQTPAVAISPIASAPRVALTNGKQSAESAPDFESRAPRALLGELPVAGSPAPAVAPITPPRMTVEVAAHRAANEPTEVHVHIGSIEVRAVQESGAPKKARTPAQRKTLSLDEYLARRRRS